MAGMSTHIGRKGPGGKRRRRMVANSLAPIIRKPVVNIGRFDYRYFDPITGCRRQSQDSPGRGEA